MDDVVVVDDDGDFSKLPNEVLKHLLEYLDLEAAGKLRWSSRRYFFVFTKLYTIKEYYI